jgi:hypothetical protein
MARHSRLSKGIITTISARVPALSFGGSVAMSDNEILTALSRVSSSLLSAMKDLLGCTFTAAIQEHLSW